MLDWSDIGSWKVIWENPEKDKNKISIKGNIFTEESKIFI